jgi:hypothetical protein
VAYQTGAVVCPQCGSSADVRTLRELFDIMNAGGVQAFLRFNQQSGGPTADNGNYNNYNAEGSGPQARKGRSRKWERANFVGDLLSDPGGAVVDAALGFAGKAISKRVKKVVTEQVMPTVQAHVTQAKTANAEQQFAQAQADQDAIVARYPELRTCLKDDVVFLDGGPHAVPISELGTPATLPQTDAVVPRLR